MVLFESCRYEAMKQCRLSYRTSQSDLSEYYLTSLYLWKFHRKPVAPPSFI